MADGILIEHASARSVCHTVPVLAKPYRTGPIDCPTCRVWHPVKVVHLWLNDQGRCLVSPGVLDELRLAGMPGLRVVGHAGTPPTLNINQDRMVQDFDHRKQSMYGEKVSYG